MKKIIFAIAALLVACAAIAQDRVVTIHRHTQGNNTFPTIGNNYMSVRGDTALFNLNGNNWLTSLSAIDSLTFSTNNVDDDSLNVDFSTGVIITWNGNQATVQNPFASSGVSITTSDGHVSVSSTTSTDDITYLLQGSSSNGSFSITSDAKFILGLDNLELTSPAAPAIWIKSSKRCFIHTANNNILSDGVSNSQNGTLQSTGKLHFLGNGNLVLSGLAKHGIQSSKSTTVSSGNIQILTAVKDGMNVDNFIMTGGTVTVNSLGDGIDGDQGYVRIEGGELTITCASDDAKGLCCDSTLTIMGGRVDISVSGDQSKAIRTKDNMYLAGGNLTITASGSLVLEPSGSGYNPSYCTGIKVGGNMIVTGGNSTVTCTDANAGGRCISADGNVTLICGRHNMYSNGNCGTYTNPNGINNSYSSTCIKANGHIYCDGAIIQANAGGRAFASDSNFSLLSGFVYASTSANGFTTIGTGTSCTDGFAPSCIKSNGNVYMTSGTFEGSSTGKGGRGITAGGKLIIGTPGGDDNTLTVYVTTSGAPVNATSTGGGPGSGGSSNNWKGLPKGIKIQDSIHVYSGRLMSYCSQTSGDPTAEAIESKGAIQIDGGIVEANSYDDAINATTGLTINGGKVFAYSRGNDGIDNNGSYTTINGGIIITLSDREVGFDASTDAGGHFNITGGTVISKGGNMGAWDTPTMSGTQKRLTLSTSFTITNGFCIKNSNGDVILTFHLPAFSGSGFDYGTGSKPPGGGGGGSRGGIGVTCPAITSGSYTVYSAPSISGGTAWHGLYDGATVTTSGSGTSVSAQ